MDFSFICCKSISSAYFLIQRKFFESNIDEFIRITTYFGDRL
jgi:hypothetical protein